MAKETFKIEIPVSVTDNTDPGVSQSKSKMSAFDKVVEKAQSRLDKMNNTKWKVAIETVDKVTSVISTIGTSVKNVTGKVWSVTLSAVDKVTSVAKGIISTLGEVLSIGTMVSSVLGGLTVADALEAAQTQTTVETQLKTVLQNMAENAEEVESIYDRITAKASALQQATIYGDEAYIAGAAELATYFTDADAIEMMMDTLANYAAGMSGGAELTTDELVDYATNLGKIMTGSYDAMTKKGFEFSDAQKAIIEGTATEEQLTEALGDEWRNMSEEMQAAQVISDIINESWDGLAETLADLPAAKVTQFKNAWGDVKEVIGNKLYPAVGDFFSMLSEKLPAVQELLEGGSDWLANAFEELIPSISEAIDGAIEKVEELAKTIKEMTESEEWQGADLFGKVKIAWDTLIAEPFSEWWNTTGKQFFVDKASSIGESIGSGITSGLLALLGIDVSDAVEDGTSVGGAFLQGFKDGFDTSAIGDAITDWAENHKEIVVAAGAVVGFNLITGLASKINSITSLFTGSGSGSSTTTASTVTVNGAVVNVYGSTSSAASTATSAVKALTSGGTGSTVAGALTSGGIGSTIVGGLASVGTALGSGAATTGGLAAAGATGIGGILGGIAGLVSAGVDVFQGYKASKEGDSKTAKTEYATAGSKAGMVATGAGIGAAIGSVVPGIGTAIGAAAGAGIGGIAGILTGSTVGQWISDATDEGGVLSNMGEAVGTFFTETIPEKWGEFWDGAGEVFSDVKSWASDIGESVGTFFTETIPEKWDEFWEDVGEFFDDVGEWVSDLGEKVTEFFTVTIPQAWSDFWDSVYKLFSEKIPFALGYITGTVVVFFTETVPQFFSDLWDDIATFFTETLPTWASDVWNGHIVPFFTEDVPEFFSNLWENIANFFTETLPTWASDIWNGHIVPFFTEDVPAFFSNIWNIVATFFTETIPTWASDIWNGHIVPFFTEDIPQFFGNIWDTLVTFFTETIPTWAADVWNNNIVPFFTEDIPQFFLDIWDTISTFFTETIPTWASDIWSNKIVPFFTETIPGFFTSLWDSVTSFVTEAIPTWASNIWGTISGWFSNISSWFSNLWSNISGNFSSGYSSATGHAWGGIMTAPHMGVVAEDGAEAIIPLSPSKSERGMDLWLKTGQLLGVRAYADGGIAGDTNEVVAAQTSTADAGGSRTPVEVKIEMRPEFRIEGDNMDEESIVAVIKAHIREMADDLSDEMAERLARAFANMPLKGGA